MMRRITSTTVALLVACTAVVGLASPAPAANPRCPRRTTAHAGVCIETKLRLKALTWRGANRFCVAKGRRLPDLAEVQTFLPKVHADEGAFEWHNLRYRAGTEQLAGIVNASGEVDVVAADQPQVYRCVAVPS